MTIGVRGLTIRYGDRVGLEDLTLEVPRGSVTAVVGGDGAGKTSLLRALAGLLPAAGGSVDRPARERIGYVPGAHGVYQDLTVLENLEFAGRAYGVGGERFRDAARDLLERLDLTRARRRLAANLSGGMRQKLALGTALLHDPELLILDEPTTGLDPVSRADIWRLLAGAAAGGAAIVLATTYLSEAERAARVLVLQAGLALAQGSPQEVVESMPGALFTAPDRPARGHAWRRGAIWRVWSPDGSEIRGAAPASADLEDAVIVAALGHERR